MTDHSVWRVSLAHKIAPAFTANPKIEACFVFGSAVLGISDQYSDLELAFIWSQLPSVEELRTTAKRVGVERWEVERYGEAHIYHPGFKWTRYWLEEMNIKPPEFFTRLERVFQSDAASGTHELRRLAEETFDLVEQCLPQIDLKQQRETFNRLNPRWELPDR